MNSGLIVLFAAGFSALLALEVTLKARTVVIVTGLVAGLAAQGLTMGTAHAMPAPNCQLNVCNPKP